MITPTLPNVSASTCKNTPVKYKHQTLLSEDHSFCWSETIPNVICKWYLFFVDSEQNPKKARKISSFQLTIKREINIGGLAMHTILSILHSH